MKSFGVILVILATAFISQNEASPSTRLDSLEKKVNNTVAFLGKYKTDLAVDGDKKFDDIFNKETAKIAGAANQTLQEIQNAIEEANNDGQNAGECYESAQSEVNNAQNRVLPVVQKCFQDNIPDWEPAQNFTQGLIEKGEEILEEIDEIREECANATLQEVCIALKLPGVSISVGVYEFAVGQLRKQVAITTAAGFRAVGICSALPLITYKVELKNARHNAVECINSAHVTTTANVMES